MELDFSELIMSPQEQEETFSHGWIKRPPPPICFNNVFKLSDAHNPKLKPIVFTEYYYLEKRYNHFKTRIEKNDYKDDAELAYLTKMKNRLSDEMSCVANPNDLKH